MLIFSFLRRISGGEGGFVEGGFSLGCLGGFSAKLSLLPESFMISMRFQIFQYNPMHNSLALNFESLDLLRSSTEDHEEITIQHLLSDIFPYFSKNSLTATLLLIQSITFLVHLVEILYEPTMETRSISGVECSFQSVRNYYLHRLVLSLLFSIRLDLFLFHLAFGTMVLSFLEKKLGKARLLTYYLGTGYLGNLAHILFSSRSCVSNIGSLALFGLSLKVEYQTFKKDDYIQYQNYNQSLGVYVYKFSVFSFVVSELVKGEGFGSLYMYLGGILFIVLAQVGTFNLGLFAALVLTVLVFVA